eukprot:7336175-Pyramimonas_sp.AAC.3
MDCGLRFKKPWILITELIEDVYDARYAHDTNDLESWCESSGNWVCGGAPQRATSQEATLLCEEWLEHLTRTFPEFVQMFYSKLYGVRSLVERALWELACNGEAARQARLHPGVCLQPNVCDALYGRMFTLQTTCGTLLRFDVCKRTGGHFLLVPR